MSWITHLIDAVPVVIKGGAAVAEAWRDRKRSPSERLATKPRPIDAGLEAMLRERKRQADETIDE